MPQPSLDSSATLWRAPSEHSQLPPQLLNFRPQLLDIPSQLGVEAEGLLQQGTLGLLNLLPHLVAHTIQRGSQGLGERRSQRPNRGATDGACGGSCRGRRNSRAA